MPHNLGAIEKIHARAAESCIAPKESARLDDIDRNAQTGAEPDERPGVLRDVRLEQGEAHRFWATGLRATRIGIDITDLTL